LNCSCRYRGISLRYHFIKKRHSRYDATGALACARRHNDVTRCNRIDSPAYSPLCALRANVTSFIKSEILNVSQRHRTRTEPRPWVMHRKFCDDRTRSSGDMFANRQTTTKTNVLITIFLSAIGGGEKQLDPFSRFGMIPPCNRQTDRQTDRQTKGHS